MRKSRINPNYKSYKTPDGERKHYHARVGEKKYGYEHIPEGFVIHHIDMNKSNNQYYNLIILHEKDHKRVHKGTLVIKSVQPSKKDEELEEENDNEPTLI